MWHTLKLLSCLATVATASQSFDGAIFTFDKQQAPVTTPQGQGHIDEDTARLLLQQRVLSTQTTTPSIALGEPVLQLLNSFGGNQYTLFQEASSSEQQKLLVVVEGLLKDSASIALENPIAAFDIPRVSSSFVNSVIAESVSGWKQCEYEAATDSSSLQDLQSCLYQHPTFIGSPQKPVARLFDNVPLSSFEAWSDVAGNKEILRLSFKEYLEDPSKASQLLTSLSELFDSNEQTILLIPHQTSTTKYATTKSHYSVKSHHTQSRRSQKSNTVIPSTLLPVCHKSNDSCISSTNACSGHGKCYLKSAAKDSTCYACKCDSQWGGPACQKIDISTQFFLIGTVSVLAVLAVGGGIGLLFSVGQEELPSVISAGVSSVKTSR